MLNSQFQSAFSKGRTYSRDEFLTKCKMAEGSYPEMNDITITLEGARKQLAGLHTYKAPRPDGISPRILKELAEQTAPSLIIFQLSLQTGIIPSHWKEAHVAPVFKKGEHYNPSNYRPISLTSISCKIPEHIIISKLMNHFEANNILCPQQHGFQRM